MDTLDTVWKSYVTLYMSMPKILHYQLMSAGGIRSGSTMLVRLELQYYTINSPITLIYTFSRPVQIQLQSSAFAMTSEV
jgi:hypothetical protein